MNGYLVSDANQARIDDLHRRAAEARRARPAAAAAPGKESRHRLLTTLREALG
jgi:hypothetical protein